MQKCTERTKYVHIVFTNIIQGIVELLKQRLIHRDLQYATQIDLRGVIVPKYGPRFGILVRLPILHVKGD